MKKSRKAALIVSAALIVLGGVLFVGLLLIEVKEET